MEINKPRDLSSPQLQFQQLRTCMRTFMPHCTMCTRSIYTVICVFVGHAHVCGQLHSNYNLFQWGSLQIEVMSKLEQPICAGCIINVRI